MKTIRDELAEHSFFKEFLDKHIDLLAGCGKNTIFQAGQMIAHEGDEANYFYIIRRGRVVIETSIPGRGNLICQTLGPGDVLGWSWLFKPYKWTFNIESTEETGAVAMDGQCLRKKCEEDHELGYLLMKKFAEIMTSRLQCTRLQLMDVYGKDLSV